MRILIDNKDLKTVYGIDVLDYSGALSFAGERDNSRVWQDKSGIEKLRSNIRYDSNEFVLNCMVKASNELAAYALINTLVEYMFQKGCFVLSLRDEITGGRECFLCERSTSIVGDVNIRYQNSLYVFKLGLRDVNPNAIKYKTTITDHEVIISYTKGQNGFIYWGDGDIEEVSNSGNYAKSDYVSHNGMVDVIIDVDKDASTITALNANFSADIVSGIVPETVQFTDTSTGTVIIWNWNFGDGNTSEEQNPQHTYDLPGTYTVTLTIFNAAQGSDIETKTNYITVRNARLLINDNADDYLLMNDIDKLLKN